MSEQIAPLTLEDVLALIRQSTREIGQEFRQWLRESSEEFDQRMQELTKRQEETAKRQQKTDEQMRKTEQKISSLGSRVGEIVENMVGGDIVEQFQALGYAVTSLSRNIIFGMEGTKDEGEIDLLLEDGDIAILIEAKTALKTKDVLEHIERLEKYRAYLDRTGKSDRWRLIGAVATASARPDVIKFAQRKGLYVIVQTGRTVEIVTPPEGFVAKKW